MVQETNCMRVLFPCLTFSLHNRDGKHFTALCSRFSSVMTSTTTSWPPICPTCWSTETSRHSLSCGARVRSLTLSTSHISTSTLGALSTTSCSTRCSPLSCEITSVRRSTCRSRTSTGRCWMVAQLICSLTMCEKEILWLHYNIYCYKD